MLNKQGDQVFLIDSLTGQEYSYEEFYNEAISLAHWLVKQGLKAGNRLAITLDNSVFFAKLYFGCLYAGVTVVPVNPQWSESHTQFVLTHSKASAWLMDQVHAKAYHSLEHAVKRLVVTSDVIEKVKGTVLDSPSLENLAIIVYTSGTTADPKGVMHTVGSLVNNAQLFIKTLGIEKGRRFLNYLPMTYLGGYYNLLLIPYLAEGSVVIAPAFNARSILQFWKPIIQYQVNVIWFIPTIISMLMKLDKNSEGLEYCHQTKILGLVGTAPLRPELKTQFQQHYGIALYENYGLSETLFLTTESPLIPVSRTSAGSILPGIELKLMEQGEIGVKTPYLMQGYVGLNVEDFLQGQYFMTGDVGVLTDAGELRIQDRKKDMIIKGGVNISPASIEAIISQVEGVELCAVVGVQHDIAGEEIIGVIKPLLGFDFSVLKSKIIQYCREKLDTTQQLDYLFELENFPFTASGKIQKNKIRAWAVEKRNTAKSSKVHPSIKPNHFFKASQVVANIDQAMSIKYNTMVYERQQRGEETIVLSLGEAFFDIPLFDFNALPMPKLYHYCHSMGIPELRQCLADYFLSEYDVKFNPETEILVTAGSKIAIYMAMLAILNPGDEVLIYEPAWVSYTEQVKLCYGVPVGVPYHESVYDFERYITNRTRLIIINNPNNPRGSVMTLEELSHLYHLAEKYNLFILSDEAYSDFVRDKSEFISLGNLDREKKHSIIVNSISKNFGISGWRIGYLIANPALIQQILKLNQHMITCAPTVLSLYVAKYFSEILTVTKPQMKEVVERRERLRQYMDKIGLSYLPGTATFYFFVSLGDSELDSQKFCDRLLKEEGVCVVPGVGYGKSCDRFVRVSMFAEAEQQVQKGLDKLKKLINKTKRA